MQKIKIIKGTALYHYRGMLLSEKPENLNISKILYDAECNTSHVYLRRRSYLYDCVVLCCILLLTYVIVFGKTNVDIYLYYNSIVTYYNGSLYVNIKNSEESHYNISYILEGNGKKVKEGVLSPGEYIVKLNIDKIDLLDSYNLHISYNTLFASHSNDYTLRVIER